MDTKTSNINKYQKTKILTASPEQLQLMLYDGAIRFCEQAREAIQVKKIEESFILISKAEKIVMEMCNSMREELAPETCSKMKALYLFCYERLITANLKKEMKPLQEALDILRHMRETWLLLMEKLAGEKAENQPLPVPSSCESEGSPELGATVNFQG
jgi:flagellar secretion chaperone FliS